MNKKRGTINRSSNIQKTRKGGQLAHLYCLFPFFSSVVQKYADEEKNEKNTCVCQAQPADFISRLSLSCLGRQKRLFSRVSAFLEMLYHIFPANVSAFAM